MDVHDITESPKKPNPKEFMEFFPYACQQFNLLVNVVKAPDEMSEKVERKKLGKSKTKLGVVTSLATVGVSSIAQDDYVVRVTVTYHNGSLTHLTFQKCKHTIPWQVFRILNETAQFYTELGSITVTSGLDSLGLHEIKKLITIVNITDICLDGIYDPSFKFASLLDNAKNLQVLSLARCKLGDNVMSEITKNMESPKPAYNTLRVLNVSLNALTDVSAKSLAQMLRTNRTLSYLNLNGNRITTEGAVFILKVLAKFPLTDEEVKSYRTGLTQYLRAKQELMEKFIQNYNGPKIATPKKKSAKAEISVTNTDDIDKLATEFAVNTLGDYDNPFHVPEMDKGKLYCTGNNVITYLGLCYNNIDYPFLCELLDTLRYQRSFMITKKQRGLAFIKIEGNPLPTTCPELKEIDDILTKTLNEIAKQKKMFVATIFPPAY